MIASALARWVAPATTAGADGSEDPFSMFAGWDGERLLWLAFLIPVAVVVLFVGRRRFRTQLGASALRPRGRDRYVPLGGGPRRDAAWRDTVDRLEQRDPTPIAEAKNGPVRICAEIVRASGNLGGTPGRECVWRNRSGAGPKTAVAADLLIIADDSGRCGIEQLEGARINAPVDKAGAHYESVSLRIGDRIEVIANFEHEVVGEHDDASQLVYGTLGTDGLVDIRVLSRPEPLPQPDPDPEAAPSDDTDDES